MKKRVLALSVFALLFCVASFASAASTYYLPYYIGGKGGVTGVAVRNVSATMESNVKIEVYHKSGTLIASQNVFLNPSGQWNDIVGDGSDLEGWIMLESDRDLASLCFVAKDDAMMDVPATGDLSKKLIAPHVAQNTLWDTIVFAANPNDVLATVTLAYYNEAGEEVLSKMLAIPAMGSEKIPLNEILGDLEVEGGSLLIECDEPITAFALYHNRKTGAYSYAGINFVDLEE